MRFILNFIFFGILFYLIHVYFPEAFDTLVSWADKVYLFFRDLFVSLHDKYSNYQTQPSAPAAPPTVPPAHSLFIILPYLWFRIKNF